MSRWWIFSCRTEEAFRQLEAEKGATVGEIVSGGAQESAKLYRVIPYGDEPLESYLSLVEPRYNHGVDSD